MISIPLIVATTSGQSAAVAPVVEPLAWVTPPPDTGVANTDYIGTWKGGVPPYHATIVNGDVEENNQTGPAMSMTANIDGANEPTGTWVWTVEDSAGTTITANMVIS